MYEDDALLNRIINAWVFRFGSSPESYSYLPSSAFSTALRSAEEHHLRGFLGQLYYAMLRIESSESSFPRIDFPSSFQGLELRHLQRVLRGSWSLSNAWQSLLSYPPELPASARCQPIEHVTFCKREWIELWGKASAEGGAPDIQCKLNWIKAYLDSHYPDDMNGLGGDIERSCANTAKGVIESLTAQVDQALPEYFLGPP
jgi:hypothetical protein